MEFFIASLLFSILLLFFIYYIYLYNKIVSLHQNVKEAWAGIDVQLKRRHELIPNLLETVKGYAKHEEKIFKEVAEMRAEAISSQNKTVSKVAEIEDKLNATLGALFAVAEAYPELKANEHFLKLQIQLEETENLIASARRIYNSNTADYNTLIKMFPGNILSSMHSYKESDFFSSQVE